MLAEVGNVGMERVVVVVRVERQQIDQPLVERRRRSVRGQALCGLRHGRLGRAAASAPGDEQDVSRPPPSGVPLHSCLIDLATSTIVPVVDPMASCR